MTPLQVICCMGAIAAAPLIGVCLAGNPAEPFLRFPPEPVITSHAPFSAYVFTGIAVFSILSILPFIKKAVKYRSGAPGLKKQQMPWWGYVSFAALACFWVLAWTRFQWFDFFQAHTFFPLWLSWIMCVNALTFKSKRSCPATRSPKKFILLFVFSSVFWWMFEYLNRFTGNWYYSGSTYPAFTYFILATLSFSTVLPAVESMKDYLLTYDPFKHAFKHMKGISLFPSRPSAVLLVAGSSVSLSLIGVFPDIFFPLLWICPFFIFLGCRILSGRPHVFSGIAEGDYTMVAAYASAAIVCGFFWEMFNSYSLARWEYAIPYVDILHLFEMPVLGYAGYLPFGLECALVIEVVWPCSRPVSSGTAE